MADVDAKIEQDYKVGEGPKALSEKYGVPVNTNTPKKGIHANPCIPFVLLQAEASSDRFEHI
ncbi:hypothetical protein OS242_04355 [Tumebacillus sp. DT12]|uniref:Uncharacterized protein n=1 Tax=Tumebacillus lacus TaxID=2995335 RepID=A0ABT3X089_9BACL|nr:hypothetical protein [Tumebacillus lacus]MCX7569182.1 hypothetical protein [Tumebacillus lacus]